VFQNIAFEMVQSGETWHIAIKNNKFIIGHIGDGVIRMLDNKDNLKTISKQTSDDYSIGIMRIIKWAIQN